MVLVQQCLQIISDKIRQVGGEYECSGADEKSLQLFNVGVNLGPEPIKHPENAAPSLPKRLFWDMRFERIDWLEHHVAIIGRLMEWGDDDEIEELIRFYGRDYVLHTLRYETTVANGILDLIKRLSSGER